MRTPDGRYVFTEQEYREHMFSCYGREQLSAWANQLKFFRYCRVGLNPRSGGGDSWNCRLLFNGEERMLEVMKALGVTLKPTPPEDLAYVRAKRPPFSGRPPLAHEVMGGPYVHWLTPGDNGFVAMPSGRVLVTTGYIKNLSREIIDFDIAGNSGNVYQLTQKDVDVAKEVEERLEPFANDILDPPEDDLECLCPKYYPEIFQST